jgi:hypothetical protein
MAYNAPHERNLRPVFNRFFRSILLHCRYFVDMRLVSWSH